ncbi:hypothetical protein CK203_007417 [Vitis vinifera]|uniref:Uncharacterized protein n=1 Tax=Vitis vinifera TaxID=29760 RepID=A0A438FAH3_VITVI|nr:hypothetical protein CK203_070580 [Vitis vinifera]RVW65822.1 hypothetical protein CK203_007417 [Vitis vinifera]
MTCIDQQISVCRFLLISSGIIYGYYAIILKIDEEDFGGHGALLQEGLFASITLFLVLIAISRLHGFWYTAWCTSDWLVAPTWFPLVMVE